MKPIVWLASFPKCGNTWARLLLANLASEEPRGINTIGTGDGIASSRPRFDDTCLIASGLLTHEECDAMRPALYRHLAEGAGRRAAARESADDPLGVWQWIKTHDAWTCTTAGEPLMGGGAIAHAAVLIVRDPRDVVASLANHNGQTLEEAATMMADPDSAFAGRSDRQPLQLRQRLLGWSGYYRSWIEQDEVPVHVLRYEDLQAGAAGALGAVLAGLGISVDPARLERAALWSAFETVQAQEAESGFKEAPVKLGTGRFFRSGRSGGWREELSDALRATIERDHGEMMRRFGYLPEGRR
ncbi:MAG: sulfotransferase domain-containing protein [Erythrobacter sp.]|uniref:sulfotransferase domain-containing protein n=1 Tax=Erythrobacter sp. TaxID=1042 RepID=UPI0025E60FF5|nr:sulfotransferase domain-containing protein [Erythrobacter sp.]MCL9999658.1 sulfotransferase domain-containing protein [Erythrobacter sp.]